MVASRAGALTGTSRPLTSDWHVATPGVEATLTVNEVTPSVSMSFEPLTIRAGGVSRLTYVLRNGTAVGATSVTLFDRLPTGVVVADPPDARTTCAGGTLTAAADGGDVSYSGGSLAGGHGLHDRRGRDLRGGRTLSQRDGARNLGRTAIARPPRRR